MSYTFGLASIKVAEVLESGLMPETSAMTKIGEVLEKTASITQEEPTFTDFKEEGNATPKVRVKQEGPFNFVFQIMNADPAFLADYIGGEVVNGAWNYYGKSINIEKALAIIPEQGLSWKMPKASISATIGGSLDNENLVTVTFNVTPLSPGDDLPSIISEVVDSSSQAARRTIYAGSVATLPTTSATAKSALEPLVINSGSNTFSFSTGTANKNFLIAIPASKNIVSVVNKTTTEPLTTEFALDTNLGFTPTGATEAYKVYKMTTAVAFSSSNVIEVKI